MARLGPDQETRCTGMRLADLDTLLGDLAREGRIRISGEAISLIYWIYILNFKAVIF
jgi:hypothetical protein